MNIVKKQLKSWLETIELPKSARSERAADLKGLPKTDPGAREAMELGIAWLCEAQDCSRSRDGGVARHYSLIDGWSTSYPETTGYIAETFLKLANQTGDEELNMRGRRMLDWLISIQFPDGGFQGGLVDQQPIVPVTFNTGQILIGLNEGARIDTKYNNAMKRAADWLVQTQDSDGCWRRWPTPFAAPGERSTKRMSLLGFSARQCWCPTEVMLKLHKGR